MGIVSGCDLLIPVEDGAISKSTACSLHVLRMDRRDNHHASDELATFSCVPELITRPYFLLRILETRTRFIGSVKL